MYRIKRLVVITFVILFSTTVFAGGIADVIILPKVIIFETKRFENETAGEPFFLCSDIVFNEFHNGNIYILFSNATINSNVGGRVYSFFSDVRVDNSGDVEGGLYYFFSELLIDNTSDTDISGSIWLEWFGSSRTQDGFTYYNNKMPVILQNFFYVLAKVLILLIIFSLRRSFFIQGCGVCRYDTLQVIKKGVAFYFTALCVGIVFFISIIGFPVVLVIILILIVLSLAGEVSLCMFLGNLIFKRVNPLSVVFSYANITVGAIIIESFIFIPYISWVIFYLLLPIISIGIMCETTLNAFVYKKLYTLEEFVTAPNVINKNIRDVLIDKL